MPRLYWLPAIALGLALALASPASGQQDAPEDHPETASEDQPTDAQPQDSVALIVETDSHDQGPEHRSAPLDQPERTVVSDDSGSTGRPDILTAMLVIFTGIIACAAIYQNWQFRKHSRQELRAYLVVSSAEASISESSGKIILMVNIKNTGKTPAYAVNGMYQSFEGPRRETPDIPVPDPSEPGNNSVLGQGDTIFCIARSHSEASQIMPDITAGRYAVWIHGRFEYADIFGRRHECGFMMRFGSRVSDDAWNLVPENIGNYGD